MSAEDVKFADCEYCGKTAELRKFGWFSRWICFECAEADAEVIEKLNPPMAMAS